MANGPNRPNRPIRPRQGAVTGRRKRRVVIDNAANRPRENARQARERQEARPPKQPVAPPTGPVSGPSGVTVEGLPAAMGKTVLDTPGHEAFTAMRARGAKVTDIAVLVVAADDGVMPQTRESISHARAAEVPIVVAVNKIDLPDADPNRVRGDLAGEGLQPEEWGGGVQYADVSAKAKQNLDELLEKVLLVADAELELKANPNAEASGPIIESRLDVGRGPVATMLVQRGTLRVGDSIVAGEAWGRVRALYNYRRERVKEAKPGEPVEIVGFDKPPPAGGLGRVVANERH